MPKYSIYAIYSASKHLGVFDAATPEGAEEMAMEQTDSSVNICHQCAREVDLGDCYEWQVEEVK